MSNLLKREVPLGIGSLIIAILFVDYYTSIDFLHTISLNLADWAVILSALAAGIGIINILKRTAGQIQERATYWYLDIWTLLLMAVVAISGVIGAYGTHPIYTWIMSYIYIPIDAAVFAMVSFDIIAAFYRTFRLRTLESSVLVVVGIFILMMNTPFLGTIPGATVIGNWVKNVPMLGSARALTTVTAIGYVGIAIRALLWKEKPSMGVTD
jgi:hypothetical protein